MILVNIGIGIIQELRTAKFADFSLSTYDYDSDANNRQWAVKTGEKMKILVIQFFFWKTLVKNWKDVKLLVVKLVDR